MAWGFVTVLMALSFDRRRSPPSRAPSATPTWCSSAASSCCCSSRSGRSAPVRTASRSARPGGGCSGSPSALFVYTAVGFAVLQDDFVPKATAADMITEFFCRLVFTTSGNIDPDTTAARWFVNSIGAVWLHRHRRHRHRADVLQPPAPPGARAGHPAAGAAAPAPVVEHRVDADVEGHHGVVHRRRPDGHRLRGRRLGGAVPRRSGRTARRARGGAARVRRLLLRPRLDPVPVRRRARRPPTSRRASGGRPSRSPRTA